MFISFDEYLNKMKPITFAEIKNYRQEDLMLFTGCKDKDDNNIYVSDIVNYVTGYPSRQVNAVVEIGEYKTYTKVSFLNQESNDEMQDAGDVENHVGFYIRCLETNKKFPMASLWIKKIGNRFVNPELMHTH